MIDVAVVGGGPAGMFAALEAAAAGARVTLLERNEKLGKKLYITGKGRCNLTNTAGADEMMRAIVRNPRFLYAALHALSPSALSERIERLGVPLKVERGGRVFPASDRASDVTRALENELRALGAHVRLRARATGVRTLPSGAFMIEGAQEVEARAIVLATGGVSYPTTGSSGDGHDFAAALGHTIAPLYPALTSLATCETWPGELAGLTLKNVALSGLSDKGKAFFCAQGELLFTHEGISGPLALSLSSFLPDEALEALAAGGQGPALQLDLKPALDEGKLEARLLRDLQEMRKKRLAAVMDGLAPRSLAAVLLRLAQISPELRASEVTQAQRRCLLALFKRLPLRVRALGSLRESIITRGGVRVREVNPSTMMSRRVEGLFLAGELLDVDALTGGFNLQIAFATGALAGRSAARYALVGKERDT